MKEWPDAKNKFWESQRLKWAKFWKVCQKHLREFSLYSKQEEYKRTASGVGQLASVPVTMWAAGLGQASGFQGLVGQADWLVLRAPHL